MLKWTGALAAAVAVGVGAGYETNQLLRPITEFTTTEIMPIAYEETRYNNLTTGGPIFVYVSKGRIVRTEPMWYTADEAKQAGIPWSIQAGGKTYTAPLKSVGKVWANATRNWVYSPTRGRYPMKRVDWDPNGDRHPETRGKSEYVRISWDQAYDIVASEMKRIKDKYGPSALFTSGSFHVEWATLQHSACQSRLFNIAGGYTSRTNISNSWEGWVYGPVFMYNFNWLTGLPNETDLLIDVMQNSKEIVLWALDPTTVGMYGANGSAMYWPWLRELGIKVVVVNPAMPYTGVWSDKWVPIYPGTDAALAASIAYVWISEGTYDKQYLDTHTIGFDQSTLPKGAPANGSFKSYIMGDQDGVPKTPEWAEKITGVKAREIRALAREWASKPTSLVCMLSGACRGAYDYEWARMMVALQTLQGLGKPGVNIWSAIGGTPTGPRSPGLFGYGDGGISIAANKNYTNPVTQVITEGYVDAIAGGTAKWTGGGSPGSTLTGCWAPHQYPMAGFSRIHMIWHHGASSMHQDADSNHWIRVWQYPEIETIVVNAPWYEAGFAGDCTFCDIYLPVCTPVERIDVSEAGKARTNMDVEYSDIARVAVYQQQCIQPLYESKSDYQLYAGLADRLGVTAAFTEGNTEEDWVRKLFAKGQTPTNPLSSITYDQLKQKGYFIYPIPANYMEKVYNPQFRWFYNMPANADFVKNGLQTPTGKIELFSTQLFQHYGFEDLTAGIAAIPKYRESWEGRNTHPLVDKYPLQAVGPHPRYRFHGKYNQVEWLRDLYKIKGPDGYEYEPIYMNPADAQARGLKHGDVVRVWNDRGQILCGVDLMNRALMPGVVHISYGAWPDLLQRGTAGSIDKAGNYNMLTRLRPPPGVQEHSCDQPWNTVLIQVEAWRGT